MTVVSSMAAVLWSNAAVAPCVAQGEILTWVGAAAAGIAACPDMSRAALLLPVLALVVSTPMPRFCAPMVSWVVAECG
mgnify:CR=1 FL=1